MRGRPSVLIVEAEPDHQAELSRWLTGAGAEVATCSGPHLAEPSCPMGQRGPCELVRGADVVVLDGWLESDTMMEGSPGWELAVAYHAIGTPLVLLSGRADPVTFQGDARVIVLERRPSREDLILAVRRAADGTAPTSDLADESWLIDARVPTSGGRGDG